MVATCILRSNDPDVESYLRAVLKKRAGVKKSDVRLVRLSMGSRSPRSRRPARTFVFKLKTVQAAEASDSERQLSDRYPPILVPT